ncbi:Shedu anti-phage system protein SduA domain-containing protein [Streptomyces sp. NPDC001288]|uniref:Shedu anti-phage system protein SduA domain-containing protein n=1 Tax=unclassified Streptomyces TaxID=2593676 RepID=UPI00332A4B99
MDHDGHIYFDRRPAASGALSYGDRIAIRDTSQVSIEAVPYFIPHRSSEDELSMKLIRVDKRSGETCQITLNDSDLRKLKRCIAQALAVAEQEDDGQYLVLRADELAHTVESSEDAVRAVGGALESRRFARRVAQHVNPESMASAFSAVVRIGELRAAITELRENLDGGVTLEDVYQRWCDKHSWAFGNAYVARDNWRSIGIGDQVDLLMKSTASGFRDIFELKRPGMEVLSFDTTHRNWYWASQTSKAIGQCHRYLDNFHRAAEHGIQPDHPEMIAYHPRAVVVIGRSRTWEQSKVKALHGLNSRIHGITVMTYDQLLARCSVLLGQVHSEQVSQVEEFGEDLSA